MTATDHLDPFEFGRPNGESSTIGGANHATGDRVPALAMASPAGSNLAALPPPMEKTMPDTYNVISPDSEDERFDFEAAKAALAKFRADPANHAGDDGTELFRQVDSINSARPRSMADLAVKLRLLLDENIGIPACKNISETEQISLEHVTAYIEEQARRQLALRADDGLAALLAERDRLEEEANAPHGDEAADDAAVDRAAEQIAALDERMADTTASTPDGLFAQVKLLEVLIDQTDDPFSIYSDEHSEDCVDRLHATIEHGIQNLANASLVADEPPATAAELKGIMFEPWNSDIRDSFNPTSWATRTRALGINVGVAVGFVTMTKEELVELMRDISEGGRDLDAIMDIERCLEEASKELGTLTELVSCAHTRQMIAMSALAYKDDDD
jgi:hypothetical protein